MAKRAASKPKTPALLDVPVPFVGQSPRRSVQVRVQQESPKHSGSATEQRPKGWRWWAVRGLSVLLVLYGAAAFLFGYLTDQRAYWSWSVVAAAGILALVIGYRQHQAELTVRMPEVLWDLGIRDRKQGLLKGVPQPPLRVRAAEQVNQDVLELCWECPVGVTHETFLKKRHEIEQGVRARMLDCYWEPDRHGGVVVTRMGVGKIPRSIGWQEFRERYPAPAEMRRPVPGGKGAVGGTWTDLVASSGLLNGMNGSGKSNWLHSAITSLCLDFDPKAVRLWLVDLKGGTELERYGWLPHVVGVAASIPETERLFVDVLLEMEAVQRRLKERDVRDVRSWNLRYPEEQIASNIIVIDELFRLREAKRIKEDAGRLVSEGRSADFRLWGTVQYGGVDVVPSSIREQMAEYIVAFRTATESGSGVALGGSSTAAAHLPKVAGRAVIRSGGEEVIVQTPYLDVDHDEGLDLLRRRWSGARGSESERPHFELVRHDEPREQGDVVG